MGRKDFQKWHSKKTKIHNEQNRVFFKEREIWFSHVGENVGFEQDGRGEEFLRPVIVLKKFNQETFWSMPLTRSVKPNNSYHFTFSFRRDELIAANISQLRLLDAKRMKYKIGSISFSDFQSLKKTIRQLLA